MNLGPMNEKLPTYPSNIQGELRLILQTKDIFMACYKQLEAYRCLVNEQNRLITKEFVQEQLQVGEDEITELKMEFVDAENKLASRLRHNELLADQLSSQGFNSADGPSVRHLALARSPHMRKQMMANRKAGNDSLCVKSNTHMIDNIALAIDEIHQEVRTKVKPLLDYYRDLFYLQLHFSLILGQVCNYCMPLVTENIGLLERVFFWAERPEFELIRKASDISDRLKEIYTRAQQIFTVLSESVRFLQSKVELQKSLETRFHERMDEQQKIKDKVLRDIHGAKQNMDMLEEENDRLVGSLVKLDPTFVDSQNFIDLAENGVMPNKHATVSENNHRSTSGREEVRENAPSNFEDDTHVENSNVNVNFEYNNNKAPSTFGDSEVFAVSPAPSRKQIKKSKDRRRKSKTPTDDVINVESVDEKRTRTKTRKRNDGRQRKEKRSSTLTGKERPASSGTEARESRQQKRQSTSRGRSPSAPGNARRRSRHRSAYYDTVSEGPVTEEIIYQKPIQGHSLKSRLLDRTKGLFDLNKSGKNKMQFISNDSDVSSLAVPLEMERGLTSASSFVSDFPDEAPTRSDKKVKKGKSRKGTTDFEQIPLRDEDMLLLSDQRVDSRNSNTRKRRSKSRNSSRKPDHNDLADFLASSASESRATKDNSLLPDL